MFNEDTGFDFAVNTDGYYDLKNGNISSIKNFGGAEYTSENANIAHKNGIEYHYYDSYYWQMNDDGTVKLKNGKPEINPYANETGFRSNVKEIMAVGDVFVQMDYTKNKKVEDIYHSYVGYKGNSIESTLIEESDTKKNKDLNYKNENTGVDLFSSTHYFAPDLGELYSCDGCKNTTIKCNDSYLNGILGNSKAVYSCRDGNFYNGTKVTSWDGAYHSEGCVKHNSTKVKGNYNKVELLASELKDSLKPSRAPLPVSPEVATRMQAVLCSSVLTREAVSRWGSICSAISLKAQVGPCHSSRQWVFSSTV